MTFFIKASLKLLFNYQNGRRLISFQTTTQIIVAALLLRLKYVFICFVDYYGQVVINSILGQKGAQNGLFENSWREHILNIKCCLKVHLHNGLRWATLFSNQRSFKLCMFWRNIKMCFRSVCCTEGVGWQVILIAGSSITRFEGIFFQSIRFFFYHFDL